MSASSEALIQAAPRSLPRIGEDWLSVIIGLAIFLLALAGLANLDLIGWAVGLFGFVIWVGLAISCLFFAGVTPPLAGLKQINGSRRCCATTSANKYARCRPNPCCRSRRN